MANGHTVFDLDAIGELPYYGLNINIKNFIASDSDILFTRTP